jgi:putative (di)nucleoside polyphosphate hydrolase
MTDPADDRPYRPCVGMMLINAAGLAFVGRRIDILEEAWQMPQGGIDADEDPRAAALRELAEEVGTDKAEIVAETAGWLHYELPAELAGRIWEGKFRGQRQKWYALRFLGTDADIDLAAHHPEFRDWKWLALPALPALVAPFKRAVYEAVVAEFTPVARRIAGAR